MKYWCLLDWGGTDIRALRRASHGSDIDYNIQLRSMAFDNDKNQINCYSLLSNRMNPDFLWAIHLFPSDLTGTSANVDRS